MTARHQRLYLLGAAVVALGGALALGLSAIGDSATYFYAPSDVRAHPPAPGREIRLGGLVAAHSVLRLPDGLTLAFAVTDNRATTLVRYRGLVPDLFRENSGVIATGTFTPAGLFVAEQILAKHDEKYQPPELVGVIHKTGKVER